MSSFPLCPIDFSSFSSVLILKKKRKKKTPHLSLLLISIIGKKKVEFDRPGERSPE